MLFYKLCILCKLMFFCDIKIGLKRISYKTGWPNFSISYIALDL